jgi:hypothetical protein
MLSNTFAIVPRVIQVPFYPDFDVFKDYFSVRLSGNDHLSACIGPDNVPQLLQVICSIYTRNDQVYRLFRQDILDLIESVVTLDDIKLLFLTKTKGQLVGQHPVQMVRKQNRYPGARHQICSWHKLVAMLAMTLPMKPLNQVDLNSMIRSSAERTHHICPKMVTKIEVASIFKHSPSYLLESLRASCPAILCKEEMVAVFALESIDCGLSAADLACFSITVDQTHFILGDIFHCNGQYLCYYSIRMLNVVKGDV